MSEEQKLYLARYVVPTLQQGLVVMYRTRPQQPLLWLADWLRNLSKLDILNFQKYFLT